MASSSLRVALAGGAAAVIAVGGMVAARSTDPCWCAQSLVNDANRAMLQEAGVLDGERDGEIVLYVACGEGEGPQLADTIILGACGTRGVLSTGTGRAGATTETLRATGRWSGSVGVAFRGSPDPDRPGKLNAACNSEILCGNGREVIRIWARERGYKFDCALWEAAGRDCAGAP